MLSLIAMVAGNGVIGREGRLLWRLPEDLRHFRAMTLGKTVIMGRKTWESLPAKFRPLPDRDNVVVSRNRSYLANGARLAHSLVEAVVLAGSDEIFVIGGAEIYRQALPLAERLYLSEVADDGQGDAYFPDIPRDEWREVSRRAVHRHQVDDGVVGTAPDFDFVVYERRREGGRPLLPNRGEENGGFASGLS